MHPLAGELVAYPYDRATRAAIIDNFWSRTNLPKYQQDRLDWDPYFEYYVKQCQVALIDRGKFVLAKSHNDLLTLVRSFQERKSREEIMEALRLEHSEHIQSVDNEALDGTIDLAARLYLMINIAVDTPMISGQTEVIWRTGELGEFLKNYFEEPQILSHAGLTLEQTFSAMNLERVAGIKVVETDNLADHLRLIDQHDKVVAIFHNVAFLKGLVNTALPEGLVTETLQTLSLLFDSPHGSGASRWWRGYSDSYQLESHLTRCGPLRLDERQFERFRFWHDRLVILKQAFDQSRPSTISQWWYDRRNGVQWYTFWVAILVLCLTIFFGLIQSIEGALQVYKAFYPN